MRRGPQTRSCVLRHLASSSHSHGQADHLGLPHRDATDDRPQIPAAARAHTPAGAEAFVRYFIERSNVAWTGPHTGILIPLCQSSAIACTGLEKDATRLAKAGHHYDGDPVTIKFVGVLDATRANNYDVLANVVQENRNEIDAAGKVYVTDKRKNIHLNFELLYTGSEWSVATMKVMK